MLEAFVRPPPLTDIFCRGGEGSTKRRRKLMAGPSKFTIADVKCNEMIILRKIFVSQTRESATHRSSSSSTLTTRRQTREALICIHRPFNGREVPALTLTFSNNLAQRLWGPWGWYIGPVGLFLPLFFFTSTFLLYISFPLLRRVSGWGQKSLLFAPPRYNNNKDL